MTRAFNKAHFEKRLREIVDVSDDQWILIEDLLAALYGTGYTHGYKAGEADMRDRAFPDVGF